MTIYLLHLLHKRNHPEIGQLPKQKSYKVNGSGAPYFNAHGVITWMPTMLWSLEVE